MVKKIELTWIQVSKNTRMLLRKKKVVDRESYNDVILRLLKAKKPRMNT